MQSKASTVAEYLKELPADRRSAIEAVRAVILKNLDKGFEESMQYGMICYAVPHSLYPAGYHCDPSKPVMYAALASQKNYMSIYMMCVYGDVGTRDWFVAEWKKAGKKIDMGKSCIRFTKLDDIAVDVIGKAIARVTAKQYIGHYESILAKSESAKKAAKASSKGKPKAAAKGKPKTAALKKA